MSPRDAVAAKLFDNHKLVAQARSEGSAKPLQDAAELVLIYARAWGRTDEQIIADPSGAISYACAILEYRETVDALERPPDDGSED